jgi:hypothetical protein
MELSFDQGEFQSQNIRDFCELFERGVPPTVLKLGQATQGNPSQLRQIALTKPEKFSPGTQLGSDFLGLHWIAGASQCAFQHSSRLESVP